MEDCIIKQNEKNFVQLKQIKIVYWGPGEAGKTTNFERLKEYFIKFQVSKGYSIATSENRTLWNDSVHFQFFFRQIPLNLIVIVSTTTGQERFIATREYVVPSADGVIFVADSQRDKMEENIRSFNELTTFLVNKKIPILIELNKRDIFDPISESEFRNQLGIPGKSNNLGNRILYLTSAVSDGPNSEVRQIFLDLIAEILKN